MSDRQSRRFPLRPAAIAGVGVLLGACAGAPGDQASGGLALADTGTPAGGVERLMVVDCLLPGQIRRLGRSTTYLSARRHAKTTRSDCEIRGGEYVLFDRSDYGSALNTLLPKAQAGDPVAQTYVGEIYEKGLGLPGPDYGQAVLWYRKAADAGHAPAQTSLGSLYERGLGVSQDKRRALDLYRQASGIEDGLVYESQLEQERAAFRQEIAVRNRAADSLRAQLASTRRQLQSASGPNRTALERSYREQQRVLESERRAAESRAERSQQELEAARALKAQEQQQGGGKSAQIGKLELVRAEQYRTALDTSKRLAGPP